MRFVRRDCSKWFQATAECRLLVAVETRVAPRPPHRSRRASFSHRALIEGQTQSVFGAWQPNPAPMRRLAASVTCLIRRCVRDMRCLSPSLRSTAFPPQPPPLLTRQHCSALPRYYAVVRLLGSSTAATPPRLPTVARDRLSDCGRDEVSQVPYALLSCVMWPSTPVGRQHLA